MLKRPDASEYPEWYHGYVQSVPGGNIVDLMGSQLKEVAALFNDISDEKSYYRYEPGKWSIKEILGHLLDTERIMSYRALRFARGDKTNIEQYDHEMYVDNGKFDDISYEALKREFRFLRKGNMVMFKNFTDDIWLLEGTSGGKRFTVRAMAYIIVGHVNHHLKIIREKYL